MRTSMFRPTGTRFLVLTCLALTYGHAQATCASVATQAEHALRFETPAQTAETLLHLAQSNTLVDAGAQWQRLVTATLSRSAALKASAKGSSASAFDLAESRANRMPQVTLTSSLVDSRSNIAPGTSATAPVSTLALGVSAPLYDGGRLAGVEGSRENLRQAALAAEAEARESLVLDMTLSTLERERYAIQVLASQRFESQMTCLSNALERIVKEDKGRASELIQARKSVRQAQISVEDAQSKVRQLALQLRRHLGEAVAPLHGLSVSLIEPMPDAALASAIEGSHLLQQLDAEARAQEAIAQTLAAQNRPQLSWYVNHTNSALANGAASSASWQAGLTFNATLYSAGATDAAYRAALERVEAARFRRTEALTERLAKANELQEVAAAAWAKARRYAEVLKDSDQVRRNTQVLWSLVGRVSLFDVMSAEGEYFSLQAALINAVFDAVVAQSQVRALGSGLASRLQSP